MHKRLDWDVILYFVQVYHLLFVSSEGALVTDSHILGTCGRHLVHILGISWTYLVLVLMMTLMLKFVKSQNQIEENDL